MRMRLLLLNACCRAWAKIEDETRAFEIRIRNERQALSSTLTGTTEAVAAYKEYTQAEEMVGLKERVICSVQLRWAVVHWMQYTCSVGFWCFSILAHRLMLKTLCIASWLSTTDVRGRVAATCRATNGEHSVSTAPLLRLACLAVTSQDV